MLNFGFRKFKLGTAFGIPVFLDWSTIFLALMFVPYGPISFSLSLAAILLAAITLHELGHSLTARLFGCETRDITLTVLGGCASLERLPRKSWQEFTVAAAGPAVSFVLGAAFHVGAVLAYESMPYLSFILACGARLNVGLGLFNLLPGFPMDGGRIFRSAMLMFMDRPKASYFAMAVGRATALLLFFGPIFGIDHIGFVPIGGSFILRGLIAWMIWNEGYREYLIAVDEERFGRWTQSDFNARVSPPPYDR